MHATLGRAGREDFQALAELWEASVRATHSFLSEEDIRFFKPLMVESYLPAVELHCARDESGIIVGFIGTAGNKIEMLFVAPEHFGKGIGKLLLSHAVNDLRATAVDVNEQNPSALGFYEHLGFVITGRSPVDGAGKPYPLLHMRLP
ncbi:acetyltransferase [Fundidesulfovibrio putealis]|uniref:acetyltransferase n=1 Tax=Fundidesulfovibrio putealis TaxID=270496 RepID=UPI0004021BAB|nr:acetyltransferase [Fundidesulfovibrio putealis]